MEKERKEAQKEVERLKKAKQRMYPMDDAALIQIEESTPAPLSGALLQHGPTPDDHQVLCPVSVTIFILIVSLNVLL